MKTTHTGATMKRIALTFLATATAAGALAAQYTVSSPDGHLKGIVNFDAALKLSVARDSDTLVPAVDINLQLDSTTLPGPAAKVTNQKQRSEDSTIKVPVPAKNAEIPDKFNELTLSFDSNCSLIVRAYDDAIAYRMETALPGQIIVKSEQCDITFPQNTTAWYSTTPRWMNEYSDLYEHTPVEKLTTETAYLPMLFDVAGKAKVLLTDSDIHDYPGLYFTGAEGGPAGKLKSLNPPAVKSEEPRKKPKKGWDRIFKPKDTFDYIAKTSGTRAFPWRIFAVAAEDKQLLNNEIVYKLATPSQIEDTSWIKPGQVAWDWWNANNIYGVDFRAGINTETYKYFIDFASKNKIPYIVLDEGWYELGDATKVAPDMDIPALVEYGRQKNVDVVLWLVWRTLDEKMEEALDLYQKWGIKGIKVDFMNRDDQDVMNFYFRCAEAAARRHMIVDFHGCHKPDGLQRTWPNVITFEAVSGLEQAKWSDTKASPDMAVSLPFIRMFCGPMDYTPGATRNAQKNEFRTVFNWPMSQGTRAQQVAMYVAYESPLQMLSDSPTAWAKEQETVDFITSVPVTWDATYPLDGKIGEYMAIARKKGDTYYAAALTNWDARDLELDFSFLPEGTYQATIFQDGVNADRNGMDYKQLQQQVSSGQKLKIHMAPGGGWAAILKKQ